jgi:hypothetical protein
MAGVACQAVTYEGEDRQLVPFVLSKNLHRRHLNVSQRAMVASKIANLAHGQRADRVDSAIALSQPAAAALVHVSVARVKRARAIQEHAPPELVAAVEKGEVSVSKAAAMVGRQQPAEFTAELEDAITDAASWRGPQPSSGPGSD